MIKNKILRELADKIESSEDGNCFINSKCIYGAGVKKCSAPESYILKQNDENKLALTKDKSLGSLFPCKSVPDWPCSFFLILYFVSPDETKQND